MKSQKDLVWELKQKSYSFNFGGRKATGNMGIYASVAGRYKLGGRISRHQYFSNQQECCQSHTCINT